MKKFMPLMLILGMLFTPFATIAQVGHRPAISPAPSDAIQYVSTNGNDSNDGLSMGTAKLTQAAAITWCSINAPNGCTVLSLNGTYNITTSISAVSNLDFECADPAATILNWTGSSSGIEFLIQNVNNVTVHNCQFRTTVASTSMAIEVSNSNQLSIDHNFILNSTYPTQANGFGTAIRVTGDGSSLSSSTIWITHNFIRDYAVAGINLDHCVDCHINLDSIYGVFNNTTSINLLLDRGVSGLYVSQVPTGAGLNGVLFRNTNQGGAYGPVVPTFSFFDQFLADTTTGGDACKFDSTLGSNNVSAHFTNSWCSFAGMNTSGMVITATANGVHISGGVGIYLGSGFRSRVNAANGVLVDNGNVANVSINGAFIFANNLNNGADAHGIYWQQGVDLTLTGTRLTNTIGADSGHQLYGLKTTGGGGFALSGNDLTGNVSGAISNSVVQLDAAGNAGINDEISNSRCLQFDHSGNTSICPVSLTGSFTASLPASTGYVQLNELQTKSSAYTLTVNDSWINVTGTTTITVPHALTGQRWDVFNSGSNTVTIQCDSGNINGGASVTRSANTGYTVTADGTNCFAH